MLPVLVINLDRSPDRWRAIEESAAGLEIRRVAAVDGAQLDRGAWKGVAWKRFELSHGRTILPGEYGCYRSHMRALKAIVSEDMPAAVVVEDDIGLRPDLAERAAALVAAAPDCSVIKMYANRVRGFVSWGTSAAGDEFGRCVHGPTGCTACYVVTNAGARALLEALRVMWLPWDVSLERGWDTGVATFVTAKPVVEFGDLHTHSTLTETYRSYRHTKLPAWRRLPTYAFRIEEYFRRTAYAGRRA